MKSLLLCLALCGCASGVSMNDDERIACRTFGCIVMTEAELRDFGSKVGSEAYRKGWTDAHKQTGRDL
jgi:hypothetical protein